MGRSKIDARAREYLPLIEVMVEKRLPNVSQSLKARACGHCLMSITDGLKRWNGSTGDINAWVYTTITYALKCIVRNLRDSVECLSSRESLELLVVEQNRHHEGA